MNRCISYCVYDGGFWFRVNRFLFSVQDRIKHRALFSERYGYKKVMRIGRWAIRLSLTD
jgi:hypothetical protein